MFPGKRAVAAAVAAAALGGCGQAAKPEAGSPNLRASRAGGHGVVDNPRSTHLDCLRAQGFTVTERGSADLLIGSPQGQVEATFTPTPGAAQEEQITGHVEGAEVIGSALLYPGNAPDGELQKIEGCLAKGVKG